jgi:hypothetical protein
VGCYSISAKNIINIDVTLKWLSNLKRRSKWFIYNFNFSSISIKMSPISKEIKSFRLFLLISWSFKKTLKILRIGLTFCEQIKLFLAII